MKFIISVLFCLIAGFFMFFQFDSKDVLKEITEHTVETQMSDSETAISHEELYLNIDDLFLDNKDIFIETVNILSKMEKDVIVIFDEDENCISQVNIDNVFYESKEIFDATEISIISNCLGYMRNHAPQFTSISLYKFTDINGIEKIEFSFSGKFDDVGYIDIGVLYSDYDYTGKYERLFDNWYKFKNGLV